MGSLTKILLLEADMEKDGEDRDRLRRSETRQKKNR